MSDPFWTTPTKRLKRQRDPRRWAARLGLRTGWIELVKEQGIGRNGDRQWFYELGFSYGLRIDRIVGHAANGMALEPLTAEELQSLAVALDQVEQTRHPTLRPI